MSTAALPYALEGKRVAVVGHHGMVGSALVRRLADEDCTIIGLGRETGDLRRQDVVESWFSATRPDFRLIGSGLK